MSQTFLGRFMQKGSRNMGLGVWRKAKAAGYSDKQIAVASRKEEAAGGRVGSVFNTKRVAGAKAARNNRNNWIHNYTGGSGALGIKGLQAGLAAGHSAAQMQTAAAGLHIKDDWGVSGMGRDASTMILNMQEQKKLEEQNAMEELMAQFDAMNAAHRDQMNSMMAMYTQKPSTISKAAPYAVGTGGNASLTASAASKKNAATKSSSKHTFGRGGVGFESTLNAAATGSAATGSAASRSMNV